ncbi:hypothetical protein AVEN_267475-1 [Araneus ventricosus]|uniref:Uncharacterized protein n=1 Tax=Araneus ventricosus TaxID=182803 RepID=A0A4Y2RH60_ARAVE|nr:hypothetical protein AVEN_267475-1 [Araneus ventricosus]
MASDSILLRKDETAINNCSMRREMHAKRRMRTSPRAKSITHAKKFLPMQQIDCDSDWGSVIYYRTDAAFGTLPKDGDQNGESDGLKSVGTSLKCFSQKRSWIVLSVFNPLNGTNISAECFENGLSVAKW